jgi:hypothetical protein
VPKLLVLAGKRKPAIFESHIRNLPMETKTPIGSNTTGSYGNRIFKDWNTSAGDRRF